MAHTRAARSSRRCVYEWAAFLVHHEPSNINMCVDSFMLPATVPIYIRSIEMLSVASCKCYEESDRLILRDKVRPGQGDSGQRGGLDLGWGGPRGNGGKRCSLFVCGARPECRYRDIAARDVAARDAAA